MKLAVIIPAYNEAAFISDTVSTLRAACIAAGCGDARIIVADDGSADDTVALARNAGALVVTSGKRNIAAARNAGARAAVEAEFMLFVDADTRPDAAAVRSTLDALAAGAVGGGARLIWDEPGTFGGRIGLFVWTAISRAARWPAGGFFFMRRDAYDAVGGFDERVFISEELWMARRLKKKGRLVILQNRVVTSARKLHLFSTVQFLKLFFHLILHPLRTIRSRDRLEIWYQGRDPHPRDE